MQKGPVDLVLFRAGTCPARQSLDRRHAFRIGPADGELHPRAWHPARKASVFCHFRQVCHVRILTSYAADRLLADLVLCLRIEIRSVVALMQLLGWLAGCPVDHAAALD